MRIREIAIERSGAPDDAGGAHCRRIVVARQRAGVPAEQTVQARSQLEYIGSSLAPGPAAATLIEGGQAQQVLGLGAYTFWNNLLYAELTGYRSLSTHTQTFLGVDTGGESDISGISPYWRVALEPSWGNNTLEFGTFGLANALYPQRIKGNRHAGVVFQTSCTVGLLLSKNRVVRAG